MIRIASIEYEYTVIFDGCSESMEVDGARFREMLNQRRKEGWKLVSVCGRVKTYKRESSCYYVKRTCEG